MANGKYVITRYDEDKLGSVALPGTFETVELALSKIHRIQGRYRFPLMVDLACAFSPSAEAGTPATRSSTGHHRSKSQMPA